MRLRNFCIRVGVLLNKCWITFEDIEIGIDEFIGFVVTECGE